MSNNSNNKKNNSKAINKEVNKKIYTVIKNNMFLEIAYCMVYWAICIFNGDKKITNTFDSE
jgi:hypothetical protein